MLQKRQSCCRREFLIPSALDREDDLAREKLIFLANTRVSHQPSSPSSLLLCLLTLVHGDHSHGVYHIISRLVHNLPWREYRVNFVSCFVILVRKNTNAGTFDVACVDGMILIIDRHASCPILTLPRPNWRSISWRWSWQLILSSTLDDVNARMLATNVRISQHTLLPRQYTHKSGQDFLTRLSRDSTMACSGFMCQSYDLCLYFSIQGTLVLQCQDFLSFHSQYFLSGSGNCRSGQYTSLWSHLVCD